jgi:hypothetical protein
MKVFKVWKASNDYRRLAIDQRGKTHEEVVQIGKAMECRGLPKDDWNPGAMHFSNPLKPVADFWDCEVGGAFAVHPRALPVVSMFLERAGQMLPIRSKDLELTVLNILEVYDCIDEDRSEWFTMPDTGEHYAVKTPFFIPQHFERSTLFKIPTRELDIYCWENNQDPEEEFKACYDANHLTGLKFDLAWTDETVPVRKRSKT